MLPDGFDQPRGDDFVQPVRHYDFGAVADWLHRSVAGLAPATPCYRKLRIAPRPGPGITSAAATHETPYGPAEVAWTLDGTAFTAEISVPPNSTAEVHLPDGSSTVEVGSGRHSFTATIPVPQPVEKPKPFWAPE